MSQRRRGHRNDRGRGNVWTDNRDWAEWWVVGGSRHRRVVNGWWVMNCRCRRVMNGRCRRVVKLRCKMFQRWRWRVMDKRCWGDVGPHQVVIRGQQLGWQMRRRRWRQGWQSGSGLVN